MKPLKPYIESPGMNGPATLKVLLSHYGKEEEEVDLGLMSNTDEVSGTMREGMEKALKEVGAIISQKKSAGLDDIRTHVENDIPAVVEIDIAGKKHFVIVYEIGKTKVYMMDSSTTSGIFILPIEEFEKKWIDNWMMTIAL